MLARSRIFGLKSIFFRERNIGKYFTSLFTTIFERIEQENNKRECRKQRRKKLKRFLKNIEAPNPNPTLLLSGV